MSYGNTAVAAVLCRTSHTLLQREEKRDSIIVGTPAGLAPYVTQDYTHGLIFETRLLHIEESVGPEKGCPCRDLADSFPNTCRLALKSYLVRRNRALKIGPRDVLNCVAYDSLALCREALFLGSNRLGATPLPTGAPSYPAGKSVRPVIDVRVSLRVEYHLLATVVVRMERHRWPALSWRE